MTPFTQNIHYLETSKAKWLARYKDIRAGGRLNGPDRGAYVSPPVQTVAGRHSNRAPASPAVIGTDKSSGPRNSEKINSVLALLADIGYSGLSIEDLGKLNPPDEYEAELNMMAEVRGYFQVSYKASGHPKRVIQ